eukprot:CAMPEP_0114654852 /NCGR_PEP_ID=MMETSP0191-20121206/10717_1 /TAXON_ID=126664 /ORGANISM="Sorites sp." /LENGTH=250 /DNA_ID=CAMNT_0001870399 /DNA_START=57 /DNA_END=804 /DNA_ORIENTATION=+
MSQSKFVGVLSGANKFGRWVPEPEIKARAVAGAANLDFSQALFVHPEITIHATAFWGGVHLIVPPNVVVEQNGRAIMGGFGSSGGLYHSSTGAMPETLGNTQITIKVRGTAVMGSVSAMVNRRANPARLLTREQVEFELQQPAPPSTTQEDIRAQIFGDVVVSNPMLDYLEIAWYDQPAASNPKPSPCDGPGDASGGAGGPRISSASKMMDGAERSAGPMVRVLVFWQLETCTEVPAAQQEWAKVVTAEA